MLGRYPSGDGELQVVSDRGRDEIRVAFQRDPSTRGVAGLESEEHSS